MHKSVVRLWIPQVSPHCNHKFQKERNFSEGSKHMGHLWLQLPTTWPRQQTNGHTDKQMDSFIA